jgi:hypothetical protein
VRVAAHRPVEELDLRPVLLQLLDQERLVHVVARQPVRLGDQDAVQPRARGRLAQAVEARPVQAGAAAAVVAEHVAGGHAPAPSLGVGAQPFELLVSGLRQGLAPRRHAGVEGYSHGGSPPVRPPEGRPDRRPAPTAAAGRPDPTAVPPPGGRPGAGSPPSAVASWSAPEGQDPPETAVLGLDGSRSAPSRPRRHDSARRPRRVRQNLSFANRPSPRGCAGRSPSPSARPCAPSRR